MASLMQCVMPVMAGALIHKESSLHLQQKVHTLLPPPARTQRLTASMTQSTLYERQGPHYKHIYMILQRLKAALKINDSEEAVDRDLWAKVSCYQCLIASCVFTQELILAASGLSAPLHIQAVQ